MLARAETRWASPTPTTIATFAAALVAVSLALQLPTATVPDSVFHNQLLAVAGWGLWLLVRVGGSAHGRPWPVASALAPQLDATPWRTLTPALAALALCALACGVGIGLQGGVLLVLLASMSVLVAAAKPASGSDRAVLPVAGAFWLAGLGSVAVAGVQYFAPGLADGGWVASSSVPGRAVGNLRQPNHLATALLCAMVMTAWLWQAAARLWIDAGARAMTGAGLADGSGEPTMLPSATTSTAARAAPRALPAIAAASIVAMVLALAMSASRTGALSLGVLVVWAFLDARLPRGARWTLALTPLIYALCWGALALHASLDHTAFYGSERLQSGSDISSSRFAIWKNAVALVVAQPWTGVGWGHFNQAWTLTPFPDRPVAFFDHTHNLPLQLAVEMGLPGAAAVLGLLAWALWRARGAWNAAPAARGLHDSVKTADHASALLAPPARAAAAMLAVLALHSLLEYPLWYAYFLLPGAWALGLFLGAAGQRGDARPCADVSRGQPPADVDTAVSRPMAPRLPDLQVMPAWAREPGGSSPPEAKRSLGTERVLLSLAGALMLVGSMWAAAEHRAVERIFEAGTGATPLADRIERGQRSRLFGHHADYAAVTTEPRDQRPETFHRPLRQLIDTRLLIAWAEALKAAGRDEEALYAAQRLREFRRPEAQVFFKDCESTNPKLPWQCETRPAAGGWPDLAP